MTRFEKIRYILTPAIGFGIGGALWGWECFRGTVGAGEVITNPFSYILGILFLGVFGSASLVLFSKDIKKIVKVILLGICAWIAGFIAPAMFTYYLFLLGGIVRVLPELFTDSGTVQEFISLKPSLPVSGFWLEFLFTGMIAGLFYALILKNRIKPMIWKGAGGFALGAIIGPVIGNLLGCGSLFASYIITFSIIGIILGIFLGLGVRREHNEINEFS